MKPFEVLFFPRRAFRVFSSIYGFMPVVPVGAVCSRWVTFPFISFFFFVVKANRQTHLWQTVSMPVVLKLWGMQANNQVKNVMGIQGCVIVFWFWKVSQGEIQSTHLTLLHTERHGADFWSDFVIDTLDLSTRTLKGSFYSVIVLSITWGKKLMPITVLQNYPTTD